MGGSACLTQYREVEVMITSTRLEATSSLANWPPKVVQKATIRTILEPGRRNSSKRYTFHQYVYRLDTFLPANTLNSLDVPFTAASPFPGVAIVCSVPMRGVLSALVSPTHSA